MRLLKLGASRSFCFSATGMLRCEAIVSTSFSGSSSACSDSSASGGIFLLSFTYSSKRLNTARAIASSFAGLEGSSNKSS